MMTMVPHVPCFYWKGNFREWKTSKKKRLKKTILVFNVQCWIQNIFFWLCTLYLLSELQAIWFNSSQQKYWKNPSKNSTQIHEKSTFCKKQKVFLFGIYFSFFFFVQSPGIHCNHTCGKRRNKREKLHIFCKCIQSVALFVFVFFIYSEFDRLNRTYFSIFRRALARSGVKNQFEKTFLWLSFYLVHAFIFYIFIFLLPS